MPHLAPFSRQPAWSRFDNSLLLAGGESFLCGVCAHHTEVYAWQNGHPVTTRAVVPVIVHPSTDNTGCVGSAAPVLVAVAGLLPGTFGGALTRGFQR